MDSSMVGGIIHTANTVHWPGAIVLVVLIGVAGWVAVTLIKSWWG